MLLADYLKQNYVYHSYEILIKDINAIRKFYELERFYKPRAIAQETKRSASSLSNEPIEKHGNTPPVNQLNRAWSLWSATKIFGRTFRIF